MKKIGFAAYLTKPVRQSELFDSLAAVFSGQGAHSKKPMLTRHKVRELRRSNARILLAEDNITNQQVALGILKKLGLRADVVANGAEALKALEQIPYDLVLMDVQMPEMDGLEATRQIRDPESAVQNHTIPVIAMTAHAMAKDREKCRKAGMNDYLSKPVAPEALAHKIKGAAANITAMAFHDSALAMETAGNAGDVTQLNRLLPQLENRFSQLRKVLNKGCTL